MVHQNKAWLDSSSPTHRLVKQAREHHDTSHAADLNAHANLLREERLSDKAEHLRQVGKAAAQLEGKRRMSESLGNLGAGKGYGE